MPGGTALLIVDPQRDFHEGGSLAVPGAIEDAERIAQLITSQAEHIDELIVTLDSHHVSWLTTQPSCLYRQQSDCCFTH